MSYDVSLKKDGGHVEVEPHTEGGTYVEGGTSRAELNVTYNYSPLYRLAAKAAGFDLLTGEAKGAKATLNNLVLVYDIAKDSLSGLNRHKAGETLPLLRLMRERLPGDRHENYWTPTTGNAGVALDLLIRWAEQHPDAVWAIH